jgi:ATP-dependent helicase/nuclease subunit B
MKVTIVPTNLDLIELITNDLLPFNQDFSRTWIIFPEKRPGHYLRKALALRIKSGYFPPIIDSFDEFIDRLYEKFLGIKDKLITPLEAINFLFDLHHSIPSPAGRRAFLSLDEFFPLGLKLYQDLEELKAAGLSREKFLMVDSLVVESIPEKSRERLQKLSFFYENFYAWLEKENYSTRASRFQTVIEKINSEILDHLDLIILAGFYPQVEAEIKLFQKILDSDKSRLYLGEGPGIEEVVKKLKIDSGDLVRLENPAGTPAEIEFFLSPDGHGQLFALNHLLTEKVNHPELASEKQVIVLPAAETLIPLHQQTLSALPEDSYNISLGYPLTRTPLYSFFDCLFNLIQTADEEGKFYAPDYLNFVLHPYTKNIYFPGPQRRAELTRILFHLVEKVFTRKKGKLFWSLTEIISEPELNQQLAAYVTENPELPEAEAFLNHLDFIQQKTIQPFLKITSIGDFASKLIDLLDFIARNSTASLHLFFEPYAEAFFEQLQQLKTSLLSQKSFQNRSSYFHLFRQLMAEARVPFPGTPLQGLQVLGFWETRCLKFEEVYLLDMNEGVLPGGSKIDSLLPFYLRKALGLLTHQEREKRTEYYLRQLLGGAKKVYLFFMENNQVERSRYVEKLLWEYQKKENEPDSSKYVKSISYRIALSYPEKAVFPKNDSILKFLKNLEFTATRLDTYLKCPLQFYYSSVLGLSEREEISEIIEKTDLGLLVHSIFKEYFKPYLNKKLKLPLDLTRLSSLVEVQFERNYSSPLSGSSFLIKEQMVKHLKEFLLNYQQPLIEKLTEKKLGLTIIGLERKFRLNYKLGQREIHLVGLTDRLELRGKELCLLDYKTSASKKSYQINFDKLKLADRSTWAEAIKSLQLPFYQLLISPELSYPAEEIHSAVLLLGRNKIDLDIEFSPFMENKNKRQKKESGIIFPLDETEETREERKEKFQLLKEIIERLLLEIFNRDIPFSASMARKDSCSFCPFTDFCHR